MKKTLTTDKNDIKLQTIYYCLTYLAIPSIEKIKLIKLIFLADKHHLLNYGRTITDDIYYAMPHGPVCSVIFNILNESAFLNNPYFILDADNNNVIKKDATCRFEMLSETDKNSLELILNKFAKYEKWDLVNLTHQYPEWQKYAETVKTKKTSIRLKTKELVSVIKQDGFNIPQKKIKILKELLPDD
jgi:uncharacterized phage-associated protein